MPDKKHFLYYIFLIFLLSLGIFLTIQTGYDRQLQFIIIILTAFFYVILGILHHLFEHDLSSKIVLEYVLMGALGISVVLFFLKGGII